MELISEMTELVINALSDEKSKFKNLLLTASHYLMSLNYVQKINQHDLIDWFYASGGICVPKSINESVVEELKEHLKSTIVISNYELHGSDVSAYKDVDKIATSDVFVHVLKKFNQIFYKGNDETKLNELSPYIFQVLMKCFPKVMARSQQLFVEFKQLILGLSSEQMPGQPIPIIVMCVNRSRNIFSTLIISLGKSNLTTSRRKKASLKAFTPQSWNANCKN